MNYKIKIKTNCTYLGVETFHSLGISLTTYIFNLIDENILHLLGFGGVSMTRYIFYPTQTYNSSLSVQNIQKPSFIAQTANISFPQSFMCHFTNPMDGSHGSQPTFLAAPGAKLSPLDRWTHTC